MSQKIVIEPITRIEGHARITLDMDESNQIQAGRLHVLEIRGFEKLLENMELMKMPQVTGRICGVCPAAHHLAAVTAIENGLGIEAPPKAQLLRELLYAGHILHSHALSSFVLVGPDLLAGIGAKKEEKNVFALLAANPDLAKKMLRLRSIGQRIVESVGGRGVHPVTAIPGGMASSPSPEELVTIGQWGTEALELLESMYPMFTEVFGKLSDVRLAMVSNFLTASLSNNGVVDFLKGPCKVTDTEGSVQRQFTADAYADNLIEHVMPASYMKSVRLRSAEQQQFCVGPLARLRVNNSFSTPKATEKMQATKQKIGTELSAIDNIEARLIEMIHCAEKIAGIADSFPADGELRVPVAPKAGRYCGMVEAPRGILIHDYTVDDQARISGANLIVATQNNYDAINTSLTAAARHFTAQNNDELLRNGVEFAVRCFDPCLACATHAAGRMPMTIELYCNGTFMRSIDRRNQ